MLLFAWSHDLILKTRLLFGITLLLVWVHDFYPKSLLTFRDHALAYDLAAHLADHSAATLFSARHQRSDRIG